MRISIASTLASTVAYGVTAWMPALLERRFGLVPATAGLWLGIALVAGGFGGTLLSGILSDRLHGRFVRGSRTRPMLLGYIILLPSALVGVVHQSWLSILLFCAIPFCVSAVQSAMPLALQEAAPANMRGQVIAIQLLIQSLCGIGLGPLLIGLINDFVFDSGEMLGWSIFITVLPIALFGIALCGFGLSERAYSRFTVE